MSNKTTESASNATTTSTTKASAVEAPAVEAPAVEAPVELPSSLYAILRVIRGTLPTLALVQATLESIDANDTGLDDEIAKRINAAASVLREIINGIPESAVVRGLAETRTFCTHVLTSLDVLEANLDMPLLQKIAQAKALVAMLSDETKIYQAKRGKDATFLAATKHAAAMQLSRIEGFR